MADSTTRYRPRDYRRVCDVCGNLRNISEMHLQDTLWVCTYDYGERVRTELDRGNARQRPFAIKPVPHPKPLDNYYPNTLETDDAAVFNFLARQVQAQCRYEVVQSGQAALTTAGQALQGLSWAARYYYDLIQENSRRLLIDQAKALLGQIADYLLTRQYGAQTGPSPSSTRASDAFFGGFLETGASVFTTDNTATSGLALLYAYRVLGDAKYIVGARAAASYLRNVQAIGSNGTHYTSSDSGGLARLYTGSLASEVSTASGFYSNSLFYPGALLSLEFWGELKTTDGDQSIGATTTVTGFTTTPEQLLSLSITDLRTCWDAGIQETTGTVINGLSSTTPREFFNAYPAVKTNFPSSPGSGTWEYVDGDSTDGTEISGMNFALALSSLYNYEGATTQVTTISDWLRTFTSNSSFETPANTSTSVLYRSTTGTYDPTISLATRLQVRDPSDFSATTINGSSLYDWGAFGLMSRLWASRNKASFRASRLYPLNIVQRFYDGNDTDGLTSDRIILRGLSGLTLQSAFASDTTTAGSTEAFTIGTGGSSGGTPTPPTEGLVFWVKGDAGLVSSGGKALSWADQSGFGQNLHEIIPPNPPTDSGPDTGLDTIDGIPCCTWPLGHTDGRQMYLPGLAAMKDRNGIAFGYGPGENQDRTIMFVMKPVYDTTNFNTIGGGVCSFGHTSLLFQCIFDLEDNFQVDGFYLFSEGWRNPGSAGSGANQGPNTVGGAGSIYNGNPLVVVWSSSGFDNIAVSVNDANQTLLPLTMPGTAGIGAAQTFYFGGTNSGAGANFHGAISEALIWDHQLDDDEMADAISYIGRRYSSIAVPIVTETTAAVTNDAVRAAQYGRSFREARS